MDQRRIFLLSPASCGGKRAALLFNDRAEFDIAQRVREEPGAPAGRSLQLPERAVFQGKAHLRARIPEPAAPPGARDSDHNPDGWAVLAGPLVTLKDLERFATVPIDAEESRYRYPLERDAGQDRREDRTQMPGRAARERCYGEVRRRAAADFRRRLVFPEEFLGHGDMARGGLLLQRAASGSSSPISPSPTRRALEPAIKKGARRIRRAPLRVCQRPTRQSVESSVVPHANLSTPCGKVFEGGFSSAGMSQNVRLSTGSASVRCRRSIRAKILRRVVVGSPLIDLSAHHQLPAGPGRKGEQRVNPARDERIPDRDVDFGVELGGHVGAGAPDAVPRNHARHSDDVPATQMRLAVVDGDPGGSRQVERAEPSAFVRVLAAVDENHHGRAGARGRSGYSWRLLGRLRGRRGCGRWNRLALRAEIRGGEHNRRGNDEPRSNHPALPFSLLTAGFDYESGYSTGRPT